LARLEKSDYPIFYFKLAVFRTETERELDSKI
jgi:hypothetical protein